MRMKPLALCLLFVGALAVLSAAPARGEEEKFLDSVLTDPAKGGDKVAPADEEAEKADNKEFRVRADVDLTALEPGDVYKSAGSEFAVAGIPSKSNTGGEIVFRRTRGTLDPDRRFAYSGPRLKDRKPPALITTRQTLLDLCVAGGWPVAAIAVLGLVAVALAMNCFWIYRRKAQIPAAFVEQARRELARGRLDKFDELALKSKGLFPGICRAISDRFLISTPDDIQKRVEVAAAGQINGLRLPVKLLNLISVAAPLMGLAGTIWGMIIVFEAVANASAAGKAQALAAGIRIKLFSTLVALIVAIPSLFLYFIFNARLSTLLAETEELTEEFIHTATVLKRNGTPVRVPRAPDEAGAGPDADDDDAAPAVVTKGAAHGR